MTGNFEKTQVTIAFIVFYAKKETKISYLCFSIIKRNCIEKNCDLDCVNRLHSLKTKKNLNCIRDYVKIKIFVI